MLSCIVFEILSLICQKLRGYVTVTTLLSGIVLIVISRLGLAMINMRTKFEVSSLNRSRDILSELKNFKWVT